MTSKIDSRRDVETRVVEIFERGASTTMSESAESTKVKLNGMSVGMGIDKGRQRVVFMCIKGAQFHMRTSFHSVSGPVEASRTPQLNHIDQIRMKRRYGRRRGPLRGPADAADRLILIARSTHHVSQNVNRCT